MHGCMVGLAGACMRACIHTCMSGREAVRRAFLMASKMNRRVWPRRFGGLLLQSLFSSKDKICSEWCRRRNATRKIDRRL